MFPFKTGSSRVIYSSWLIWVSLPGNRPSFNYHLSPKAKLSLILVVLRFNCQHLIWFQFVFSHFERFHWHQDMSRLFEPLANGFYVEIHLSITQCPLLESFVYLLTIYVTAARSQETLFAIGSKIGLKYVGLFSNAYSSKYLLFQTHQVEA